MREFVVKRIYDEVVSGDGYRVLADRLWPRGVSRARAGIDLWAKEVTPSAGLRRAFHRAQISFGEFETRYRAELAASGAAAELIARLPPGRITLLTAVKDQEHSHLPVLLAALREQ